MAIHFYKGFNINSITSKKVSDDEAKEKGFDPKKIESVDKNKNGFIEDNEFINFGINDIVLHSIFVDLAGEDYNTAFENKTFDTVEQLNDVKETIETQQPETLKHSKQQNNNKIQNFSNNQSQNNKSFSVSIPQMRNLQKDDY